MTTQSRMAGFGTQIREGAKNYCSVNSWRKRFPISLWLPKYKASYLLNDIIAGFTVGLTVIPQALAYASIARLPVQVSIQGKVQMNPVNTNHYHPLFII